MGNQANLESVDWSAIPAPEDDGAASRLEGIRVPSCPLASTAGGMVDIAALPGRALVYAYPMTGRPGIALPEGWDMIPGARGCTPQSCSFRDHFAELRGLGVDAVFGLSTQDSAYQGEAANRLHLPFALLSDIDLDLAKALDLPVMKVAGMVLLKRLTMLIDEGRITKVFYPIFPPDRNAEVVLDWLRRREPISRGR